MQQQATSTQPQNLDKKTFNQNEKPKDVRKANIIAAKGIIYDLFFSFVRCGQNISWTKRHG
jgi:hypothetical protein